LRRIACRHVERRAAGDSDGCPGGRRLAGTGQHERCPSDPGGSPSCPTLLEGGLSGVGWNTQ
jgi:hypothetical protein